MAINFYDWTLIKVLIVYQHPLRLYFARLILLWLRDPALARVNLQPAQHILFRKQFSKMCHTAFSVSGHPRPRGLGSKLHQNVPQTGGDGCVKFYQDTCRSLDFH